MSLGNLLLKAPTVVKRLISVVKRWWQLSVLTKCGHAAFVYFFYHLFHHVEKIWHEVQRTYLPSFLVTSRSWFYSLCKKLVAQPTFNAPTIRAAFRGCADVTAHSMANAPHRQAAADRSSAEARMSHIAAMLGYSVYNYQQGPCDVSRGVEGSLNYYWPRDLLLKPVAYKPPNNSIITMVDVDEYVDLQSFLSHNRTHMVLLYTVRPDTAGVDRGEYSYSFDQDNNIEYTVQGGSKFVHKIWDLNSDMIFVEHLDWHLFTRVGTVYYVEQIKCHRDHVIILLIPAVSVRVPSCFTFDWLNQKALQYFKPVNGKFAVLTKQTSAGKYISIGLVGQCQSVKVSAEKHAELIATAIRAKHDITGATIQRILCDELKGKDVSGKCNLLAIYYNSVLGYEMASTIDSVVPISTYQLASDYDFEAKPSVHCFMNPIIEGAFAADKTYGNDKFAVQERIERIKADVMVWPKDLLIYSTEFLVLLIPDAHLMDPVDIMRVRETQNRPTQRRILAEGDLARDEPLKGSEIVRSFAKSEVQMEVKPPRIISTLPGDHKLEYSSFTYALADHIKQFDWYAFGKTPVEVATRVAYVCGTANVSVVETDYSRFDGRIGNLIREFEAGLLVRAFKERWHPLITSLHRRQLEVRGVTRYGYKYESQYARLSGSSETSLFNTIVNAYLAYCTYRSMGLGKHTAFNKLGVYGGDDGLSADINADVYCTITAKIGQVLEVKPIMRGQLGVKFLARYYGPEVWLFDNNSMCDIHRQLVKFHTTVDCEATPKRKLIEKSMAFYLTDAETPIIGDIVSLVMNNYLNSDEKYEEVDIIHSRDTNWWGYFEKSVQFPNKYASWMYDVLHIDLPWLDPVMLTDRLAPIRKLPFDGIIEHLLRFDTIVNVIKPLEIATKVPVVINNEPVSKSNAISTEQKSKGKAPKKFKAKPKPKL